MIRDTRLSFAIGLATMLVLGSASVAHAQYQAPPPGYYAPPPGYAPPPRYGYPPPPPPPRYREGLTFGGALGWGEVTSVSTCYACGSGLGWELHIGGMINPQLALLADFSGVVTSYDDINGSSHTLTNSLFAAALQYWLVDRLWVKGGVGGAHVDLTTTDYNGYSFDNGGESALGILAAGGYELLSTRSFALDAQLRYVHGFYSGGGASNWNVLVGLNWY